MFASRYGGSTWLLSITVAAISLNAAALAQDQTVALRESILAGPQGKRDMRDLVGAACQTRDPSRQEMHLALLLRRQEAVPILQQRLRDGPDDEKYEVLMLIQGPLRWRDFEPAILEVIKDKNRPDRVRARAATACALFQRADAIPEIRDILQTAKDDQARQWAAMALGVLQDDGSRPLVQALLNDPSAYVRVCGAMVLGMLGSDAGQAVAIAASHDKFFGLRCRAAEALTKIATPPAIERLKEMAKADSSPTVREESAVHLAVLEIEALDKAAAIARLQNLLAPGEPNPPRWAFSYLADHYGIEAKPFLHELAVNNGPLQRAAAVSLMQTESAAVQLPHGRRLLK